MMMNSNYESVIQFRKTLRSIRKYHLLLCLLGFLLSGYTFFVELKLAHDPNYVALCDISQEMSCTRVFRSEWGTGFGIIKHIVGENSTLNQPNGFYGLMAYPIFTFTSRFEYMFLANITLIIGVAGILLSGYLGYILLYVIEYICVVCFSVYTINFFLFITSILYYRNMKQLVAILKPSPSPPRAEVKKQV